MANVYPYATEANIITRGNKIIEKNVKNTSTFFRADHRIVTLTLNFLSFVQGPEYFRFKNSFLKDSFFTAKLSNMNKEIVIANSIDAGLGLDCNLSKLQFLARKERVSAEFLLQRIKEEITTLSQDQAKKCHSKLSVENNLNDEAIRITLNELDSISGHSPVLEKHLAFLKNNALEIQNQENILLGRQSNYNV